MVELALGGPKGEVFRHRYFCRAHRGRLGRKGDSLCLCGLCGERMLALFEPRMARIIRMRSGSMRVAVSIDVENSFNSQNKSFTQQFFIHLIQGIEEVHL